MIHPNIVMLSGIARALGTLCDRVVFVGGATVPLFLTDPAAPSPRSTRDVDVIAQIATRSAYYQFSDELRRRGFLEDVDSPVLCRWRFPSSKAKDSMGNDFTNDLILDVMPTDPAILGFSNLWYDDAIITARTYRLDNRTTIQLATAPHFVATKIEAFLGRGHGDFLGSSDMEDIITLLDGRPELGGEIKNSDDDLRMYLASQVGAWLKDSDFLEALSGHLLPDAASQARRPLLLERLKNIASLK
jgi:hypothetical protein